MRCNTINQILGSPSAPYFGLIHSKRCRQNSETYHVSGEQLSTNTEAASFIILLWKANREPAHSTTQDKKKTNTYMYGPNVRRYMQSYTCNFKI